MYYRPLMYNEEVDAKKIYENGFTNKEYNFYESILVAKYVRRVLGYGDARIKTFLKEFCKNNDKFFVEVPNLVRIRLAVAKSRRAFVNKSNPVSICQSEIETIKNIEGYKKRKVLFAILVLAKNSNDFINKKNWNNIRGVLHSKITNKEIFELILYYNSLGLLYATLKDSHKILFIDRQNPSAFQITSSDINNLKKTFEDIFGKDLFECVDCHASDERKSYNQKRCSKCSEIHKRERWRIQKIRQRSKMSAY